MKKILLSLATVVAVAGMVTGATVAFYNDTETSTGNIVVAGALDLKVDAGGAYYNGLECSDGTWTCEPWADQVVAFDQGVRKNGTAVNVARSNPSAVLGAAETAGNPSDSGFVESDFASLGFYHLGFGGTITLKFDNAAVNGPGMDIRVYEVTGGSYPDEKAFVEASQDGVTWVTLGNATRDEDFDLGTLPWARYIRITDDSDLAPFETTADGFDLDAVEALHCGSDPTVEDMVGQTCDGSWALTNLTDQQFFNFSDIKPGDFGKNVISFHLDDNDGWVCLVPHDLVDAENTYVDPELEAGDVTDGQPNPAQQGGELSGEIKALAWNDNDSDGYFEPNLGETLLYNGTFFNLFGTNLAVADSGTGAPLSATTTKWIGLTWCAGGITYDNTWGLVSCDGSLITNQVQTDSVTASLSAYTEQARNNPTFKCEDVNLNQPL